MEVILQIVILMVIVYNLQIVVAYVNEANTTIDEVPTSETYKGTATFYKPPYIPSRCYKNRDHGTLVAAASGAIWKNMRGCGDYYLVKCVGGTNRASQACKDNIVYVEIVDYCGAKSCGTINLSEEAFNQIADPNAGRILIEYSRYYDESN